MPQISVIVPVYKVEQYLSACVDSILTQTFRDFELIPDPDTRKVSDGERKIHGRKVCRKLAGS